MIQALYHTLNRILRHPLNRRQPLAALFRFGYWQWLSRFSPSIQKTIPFVGNSRLILHKGDYGATANYYCGLAEFESMAFLLHFLRPGDLFVDVGANIGSYSILASSCCGAFSMAIEPVPTTFSYLLDNLTLNRLEEKVKAVPLALGAQEGALKISTGQILQNRILPDESSAGFSVQSSTLDSLLGEQVPVFLKLDAEGYEGEILKGAQNTLNSPVLQVVLIEMDGLGERYGHSDSEIDQLLRSYGFRPFSYSPRKRALQALPRALAGMNLYLREEAAVLRRLQTAPRFLVLKQEF